MDLALEYDLWEHLAGTAKPIVMYGMGNGADKILAVCEKKGICVSDFFASDGFVRGHLFHGKRVLSYSEIKEKYSGQDIIVLLSFATSLPDVIGKIKEIAAENEFYAPDVPAFGNTLFDMAFFRENEERFDRVHDSLADEESKRIYLNVIKYKISGIIDFLFEAESDKDEVYYNILEADSIRKYADLGAYNGDTVRQMLEYSKHLEEVIAMEPDRRSFRKLEEYAAGEARCRIRAVNLGAWDSKAALSFDSSGNRNASLSGGSSLLNAQNNQKVTEVCVDTLDSVLDGRSVDYIKYDVEGSEAEALRGSANTIREFRPKLLISIYHRSEDMFLLPEIAMKLRPKSRLYLRRFPYIPAWDLNLYLV